MNARSAVIRGSLCIALVASCIDPPAASTRSGRTAAAAARVNAVPLPHAGDDGTAARVRVWLREQTGSEAYVDGAIVRTPDNDTAQVQCVRVSPNGAPDPARASRLVCVSGQDVLAGEDGYQRYLRMHEFDPVLAQPAAHVLLNLRDQMLGFTGRTYTEVQARAEADVLVIDARGATKTSATAPPIARHWRVTIARDGTTREQLVTADSDAGTRMQP